MRAKVNAFSKLYDIAMTKAKRQKKKAITDFLYIMNINYKVDINI